MDNRSREQKAVDKLVDSIADIRFQDGNFAYMIMGQPPKVQRRFMRLFLHAIKYWAVDWKHENYHLKDEQSVQLAGLINTVVEDDPNFVAIIDKYEPPVVEWNNNKGEQWTSQ
jgi:hypothetical protein